MRNFLDFVAKGKVDIIGTRFVLLVKPTRALEGLGSSSDVSLVSVLGKLMLAKGPGSDLATDTFQGYEIGLLEE